MIRRMTPALHVTVALHAAGATPRARARAMALGPGRAARKSRRPRRRRVLAARPASAEPEPARRRRRRRRKACLTFDDGPHAELTPRVLALLDEHQAKASFFSVGEARAHPEIVREIARRGHSVENHTYRHSNFPPVRNAAAENEIASRKPRSRRLPGARPSSPRPRRLAQPAARAGARSHGTALRLLDAARARQRRCQPAARARAANLGPRRGDVLLLHDDRRARSRSCPRCSRRAAARGLRASLSKCMQPLLITRYTAVNCLGAGGAALLEALRANAPGSRPANSRPPRSIPGAGKCRDSRRSACTPASRNTTAG